MGNNCPAILTSPRCSVWRLSLLINPLCTSITRWLGALQNCLRAFPSALKFACQIQSMKHMLRIQQAAYVWPIVRKRQLRQPARKLQLRRAWTWWHFLCSNKETFLFALQFIVALSGLDSYVTQQFGFIHSTNWPLAVFNGGRLMMSKCQERCELPCMLLYIIQKEINHLMFFVAIAAFTLSSQNVCVFSRVQPPLCCQWLIQWALSPEWLPTPANPLWKVGVSALGLQNLFVDTDVIMCLSWQGLMQIFWCMWVFVFLLFFWARNLALCSFKKKKVWKKWRVVTWCQYESRGWERALWFVSGGLKSWQVSVTVIFASDCTSLPAMSKAIAGPLVSFVLQTCTFGNHRVSAAWVSLYKGHLCLCWVH